jgi:hypothetical protein
MLETPNKVLEVIDTWEAATLPAGAPL